MHTIKTISILSVALAACGVKVNGKSYGLGGNSSASSSSGGASPAAGPSGNAARAGEDESEDLRDGPPRYAEAGKQCYVMGADGDHPPVLSSPADPWLGVSGDEPVELDRAFRMWQAAPDCSAQHDHCLRDCVWFLGDPERERAPSQTGPVVYRGDGNLHGVMGSSMGEDTLYRTVPATKRMLTRGAVVVALDGMLATPGSPSDGWHMGQLDRVDWKARTIYMIGSPNPYLLSSARVAVLSWRAEGKVQILGGRKRGELAVRADELFLPKTVIASSDPWAQVKDGQPIVATDAQPFATVSIACTSTNDHCLRPWAWLVDNRSGHAFTARWDGKTFKGIEAIDDLERIDGIVAAYRTVPATRANVKVGAMVFLGAAESEAAAHRLRWDIGKVTKIRDDGKLDVALTTSNSTWPIDLVRVPVVVWYPGEKAEAVE
ncbi:MAG: hypothetical protein F9K40_01395 [Kofleriaceae bacterium]|nr:MAG: hypothetical protein F9K40_01395 [Kofleriaceae bacterium]